MDKLSRCKEFSEKLKSWRIHHQVYNSGYHIQIQKIHNFYPSKGTYYNSETGKKCRIPVFNSRQDVLNFLQLNLCDKSNLVEVIGLTQIIEILESCFDLTEAIEYFTKLNTK